MYIQSLTLNNFRNIEHAELIFGERYNVIHGNNAQGKTNTVEAIYLMLTGKSHRESVSMNFIQEGKCSCFADAEVSCDDFTGMNVKMSIDEKGKRHFVNSDLVRSRQALLDSFSVVIFDPEDSRLVVESPQVRRNFINESISILYPGYTQVLAKYNKALKQRNSILKEYTPSMSPLLEVYDDALVDNGTMIAQYRIKFLKELNEFSQKYYDMISGGNENISLSYSSNIINANIALAEIKNLYAERLAENKRTDIICGTTSVGVHHDDIIFFISGKNAKKFGSQGQRRSIALSLKFALCELIEKRKYQKPIILLDDVMSELDENRRSGVGEIISDNQVFITCTNVDFDTGPECAFFNADGGDIARI